MRLERISPNKIKYSITFEELSKKGFLQDEILKDTFIWDVLFDEMLDEASRLYQLSNFGAVSIEIFSLTSNELVLILTLEEEDMQHEGEDEKIHSFLKEEETESFLYQFEDLDDLILLAKRILSQEVESGYSSLYWWKEKYYLTFDQTDIQRKRLNLLCTEYGETPDVSLPYLEEYGRKIIDGNAIPLIDIYF